ncbi:hypothetical protein [Campylobacter canadensis]|uniref:hypothetical protein n=1 Tax=Campylobacter canadensis TaxID=449520 RepID=UPI001CC90F01|nr:hypothetical protein [Campylobacter canadensis]MBZ8002802.1 hypothetical protein [Campylobacter canadensis]
MNRLFFCIFTLFIFTACSHNEIKKCKIEEILKNKNIDISKKDAKYINNNLKQYNLCFLNNQKIEEIIFFIGDKSNYKIKLECDNFIKNECKKIKINETIR